MPIVAVIILVIIAFVVLLPVLTVVLQIIGEIVGSLSQIVSPWLALLALVGMALLCVVMGGD